MAELTDLWVGTQNWLFETFVGPVIFWLGQMAWYEPAYNAVEFVMLGVLQIAVIALGMRFFERRWPLEKSGDDRLISVDRVYTVLNKLGIVPFAIFVITIAVAEAAVGLGILIALFRNRGTVLADEVDLLKW